MCHIQCVANPWRHRLPSMDPLMILSHPIIMNSYLFLFILLLVICWAQLIIMPETFQSGLGPHGLFPSRDQYCESRGLMKAYPPQTCQLGDGSWSETQNCRCVDISTGDCRECYPPVNLNKVDDYTASLQDLPLTTTQYAKPGGATK